MTRFMKEPRSGWSGWTMTRFRKELRSGWSRNHVTWLDKSHDFWRLISVNGGGIVTRLKEELRFGRWRMSGDDIEYEVAYGGGTPCRMKIVAGFICCMYKRRSIILRGVLLIQLREVRGGMPEQGRGRGAAAGRRVVAAADVDDQGEEHEDQADREGDRLHAAGASPRRQAQEEAQRELRLRMVRPPFCFLSSLSFIRCVQQQQ
uniref:Uncharacterized protein n=1 Tax=Oryza brachyantha TaxID=4533 RepID=J3LCJ2_ORYBR